MTMTLFRNQSTKFLETRNILYQEERKLVKKVTVPTAVSFTSKERERGIGTPFRSFVPFGVYNLKERLGSISGNKAVGQKAVPVRDRRG